jgi:hypothetical protein
MRKIISSFAKQGSNKMPNHSSNDEDEVQEIFDHPVFKFGYDIAWDCPVSAFMDSLENWNGQVLLFETKGPAGGNPHVVAGFYSRSDRDGFATDYQRDNNINPVKIISEPGDRIDEHDWQAQLQTQDERGMWAAEHAAHTMAVYSRPILTEAIDLIETQLVPAIADDDDLVDRIDDCLKGLRDLAARLSK